MEQQTDYLGILQFGIRLSFMQVIARASREGRNDDARLLATLALHLCHDSKAYPFEVSELSNLDRSDYPSAMEFISGQRGYAKSNLAFDDDPMSELQRLIRYAKKSD